MTQNEDINSMLKQIAENQRMALELQREHLDLARAQLERSNQSINESLELQRTAVARQSMLTRILLPLVAALLALLVYLLVRWNVL